MNKWAGAVLCLVASSASAQTPNSDAQIQACKKADGAASIAACSAIISSGQLKGAELSAIYYARGLAYDTQKQYVLAIPDYHQAVLAWGDNRDANYNRGVACNYLMLSLSNGATANLTADNAETLLTCGSAYGGGRQFPRAIEALNVAIKLKPDYVDAYLLRGSAYWAMNQKDRALAEFDQAISSAPGNNTGLKARALSMRANLQTDLKQYAKAAQDFDQSIALNGQSASVLNSSCWTRALWGQELDTALAHCNESLRIRPNDSAVLNSRGLVYFRRGEFEKALTDYTASLTTRSIASSYYVRGLAKLKLGDKNGGQDDIDQAKQIDRNIAKEYEGYGVKP